ncbi:hypothetical protein X797_008282 [Metarhizium robertsii]|uniref:Uncharacterized protein n=1 Tax=Metarhizium robertsii TaxID=568076 RepID=A0A014QWH9_9HYPO|nr:hypothetical protein X797_008282 [Metarhizium robertsii]
MALGYVGFGATAVIFPISFPPFRTWLLFCNTRQAATSIKDCFALTLARIDTAQSRLNIDMEPFAYIRGPSMAAARMA